MTKKIEIEVLSVSDLEREYETDRPLEDYVRQAEYIELIESEGELFIPAHSWRRFVRQSIHIAWEPIEGRGVPEAPALRLGEAAQEGAKRFVPRWNTRRQELIAHNPWLGTLAESFVSRLLTTDPSAAAESHGSTITLIMSRGRRAGLRLRAGRGERSGLWLVAERNGKTLDELVRSESDFERGLRWLQDLPDY
ncbi:MAG: hypothetical protein M3P30_02835 [Chloroflexota bacterium]|nr:hypothetical protein [Chloroflexota bacterium]